MKILTTLASYSGNSNPYIKEVIGELNQVSDVVVFSPEKIDIDGVKTELRDKSLEHSLVFEPRQYILDHLDEYDYFLYNEDDILIKAESLLYAIEVNEKLIEDNIQNNGHIPITQLKGDRSFETLITGSGFKIVSCSYEVHIGGTSKISSRLLSASYFYPFTQYQLSVLRENETLILNLNKPQELPQGLGELGYALVPENTSQLVKDNLEYFLEKAGLLDKTTSTFIDNRMSKDG